MHSALAKLPHGVAAALLGRALAVAGTPSAGAAGAPLLGNHEQLSQFASRDSLLVGRNFPVTEFRETRRVGPRDGAGLENLAPPGSQFRANSLYFPCRSGISALETGSRSTARTAK